MTYRTITVEKRGAADWLTLNRPDLLNAISLEMVDELSDYFGKLYNDRETRVVVMRGAGRAFCAGLDIEDRQESDLARSLRRRVRLSGPSGGCLRQDAALPAADRRAGAGRGVRRGLRLRPRGRTSALRAKAPG
jgi:enoyl-CoA hydratase/carnithine racemase